MHKHTVCQRGLEDTRAGQLRQARLITVRGAADMVGDLSAEVVARCHAEPDDLCAVNRVAAAGRRSDVPMIGRR
jgi:hypothetical protein